MCPDGRMRRLGISLFFAIAMAMLVCGQSCSLMVFLDNRLKGQMKVEPFEPFTLKSHMLLFASAPFVYVIDTDTDTVVRKILITNAFGLYAIQAEGKIYVSSAGLPVRPSSAVAVIYPERGYGKTILLKEELPSGLVYNPVKKRVVVTHGVMYVNPEEIKKRGGRVPYSLINTENDTVEKVIYLQEPTEIERIDRNGDMIVSYDFFGSDGYYTLALIHWDSLTTTIINSHCRASHMGDWGFYEHGYGIEMVGDTLYETVRDSNIILTYSVPDYTPTGYIALSGNPVSNYYNCIGYYPDSNYIILGGSAIGIMDRGTSNIIRWITNYTSHFKINNHKLYVLLEESQKIAVLSITNGFQWIKDIPY